MRAGAFPTGGLGEICGRTVDDERGAVWTRVWMRSWTKDLVRAQARADDAQVAWRRVGHRVTEERIAALAIEFIAFCFRRRAVEWPQLYDEMCYVAGNRLYKGLGYDELREAGLDFTLSGLARTSRVTAEVTRSMRRETALAS
jgi:hypothetical protein